MSPLLKDFIKLSLGTVFVYIIVTHGTGASRTLGALGQNGALIYKTLQGRG